MTEDFSVQIAKVIQHKTHKPAGPTQKTKWTAKVCPQIKSMLKIDLQTLDNQKSSLTPSLPLSQTLLKDSLCTCDLKKWILILKLTLAYRSKREIISGNQLLLPKIKFVSRESIFNWEADLPRHLRHDVDKIDWRR